MKEKSILQTLLWMLFLHLLGSTVLVCLFFLFVFYFGEYIFASIKWIRIYSEIQKYVHHVRVS